MDVDVCLVYVYIMGEYGDFEFVVWLYVNIVGVNFEEFFKDI